MAVAERAAVAVLVEVVGQRLGAAYLGGPEPVEAGVDDHPVQPGGDRGVAAERPGPAVRRDQAVLQPVGGVVGVAHRAQGDRPEPVAVAGEEHPERVGVAGDVGREQVGVAVAGSVVIRATIDLGDLAAEAVRRLAGSEVSQTTT